MRVGHAVEDDEERRFAARLGQRQHVVHRLIRIRGNDGDQPLMAGRHRVQMRPVHFLHDDLLLARHRDDFAGRADELALRDQQLLHVAPRLQRLADGVAANEQVARLFLLRSGRRHRAFAIRAALSVVRTLAIRTALSVVRALAIPAALSVVRALAIPAALSVIRTLAIRTAFAVVRAIPIRAALSVIRTLAIPAALPVVRALAIRAALPVVRALAIPAALTVVRALAIRAALSVVRAAAIRTAVLLAVALRAQGLLVVAPVVARAAGLFRKLIVVCHNGFLSHSGGWSVSVKFL